MTPAEDNVSQEDAPQTAPPSSLLRHRNFWLLWCAHFFSGTGDVLYRVGVLVKVFEHTGSALQTTGVLVAISVPAFLLGPFAGAIVDRYPRKYVVIAMDVVRAALVGLLLLFVSDDSVNVSGVYAVVAGLSAASAFHLPAKMALIPTVVPRERLVSANSIIMSTGQGTLAFGYLSGGLLVLYLSFGQFVGLDVLMFSLAAGASGMLRFRRRSVEERRSKHDVDPVWRSVWSGFVTLRKNKVAWPLVVMEFMEHVPHGIWSAALLLVFVSSALDGNSDDWGNIAGLYFAGRLVGAIGAGWMIRRLGGRAGLIITSNAFLCAVLTFLFAHSPEIWIAVFVSFLFGPPMSVRDVTQDVLLQSTVEENVLGRVYALRNTLAVLFFMMSGVFFSWLADRVDIRTIYEIGALLYLGTAVYAACHPGLRAGRVEAERVKSG